MNVMTTMQRLFREIFDDDGLVVTPETCCDDIDGWDSVAQVKLMLAVEEAFDFQFDNDDISSIRTVGDFAASVESRRRKAA